jgi:hypothetical protein
MIIHAPFTEEQVKNINEYQVDGMMHPFTCPCDHDDFVDGEVAADHLLIATKENLYCSDCDYQQYWVHDFMADGTANAQLARLVLEEKKE